MINLFSYLKLKFKYYHSALRKVCPESSIIDNFETIIATNQGNHYFPSQSSRIFVINYLNRQPFRTDTKTILQGKNTFIDKHVSAIFLLAYILLPVVLSLFLFSFRHYGFLSSKIAFNGQIISYGLYIIRVFTQIVYPFLLILLSIFLWVTSWNFRDKLRLSGFFFLIWAISFWGLLPIILGVVINLFKNASFVQADREIINSMIAITVQSISYMLLIGLYFWKFYLWKASFLFQFKTNFNNILIWTGFGVIAVFILNWVFNFMSANLSNASFLNFFFDAKSDNQAGINKIFNYSWFGKVSIFIQSICLAPLIEESACREGIFSLSKTKKNSIIVWISSILFFSNMHVMNGDSLDNIGSITGYLGGAIVFSTVYMLKKNIAYTFPIHLSYNLLAFIMLLW
ncbi:type II CAAX prenyl endopeptidase Rce1 family protein [Mycoplasma sp. SG1]|uniref:CPBP family glutamic-type intramembrane protease n=1 Tax=Mycoplasma sp. SG1 TaxID=2810348 RepID=UPI0020259751|nr:CPBP family glutamic-type intramembrane protease [Mycoplasma sp. SG1]URM53016.1 CPBP family intramembrane metalloprotease [Mycoplasma sp. SG1]